MDFSLTDEQRMLQDGLRRLLTSGGTWDAVAEMGVIGMLLPEEKGGYGGAGSDLMVVFEEIGRAGSDLPLIDTGVLGAGLLAAAGQDVDDVLAGGARIALAHAEPGSRYDLAHVETRAEENVDGWRLTGRKSVVVDAPNATRLLVTARPEDHAPIALFEVDPKALDLRGYPLTGGGEAAEIALDATPATLLWADADAMLADTHARATLAISAEALGLMESIRALTVDYLRTRKQFGRPIGKFQVLQHRMADLLIEIEQARSAVVNLAGHIDTPDRDRHVAATKNLVGEVARLVVEDSIQMHGGIGVTEEYDLGRLAKRLSMVDHRFGDTLHHLERFIELSA
ncbi:acyl-CoA dehydrogenase family protein [Jannaschia formosa]|uniref:acyl-CoA dehydrogenase family protein n=1 Tax=Jannaschia formosa TaxID=2259592 RepID=UPI000E1C0CE5|nr:acyl-CoA dehydrogenase family protein [Jannaschia formosa]TFL18055.1 pimeloyl-CoA dehydrogenase small subunit [Jannaschia formosa]